MQHIALSICFFVIFLSIGFVHTANAASSLQNNRPVVKPTISEDFLGQRDVGSGNDETRVLQAPTTKIPDRGRLRNRSNRTLKKSPSSLDLSGLKNAYINTYQSQKLIEKFYSKNALGKPNFNIRKKMISSGLKDVIDKLGLKEKDVSGKKIPTIDLSWPNIRELFQKKFDELEFKEKRETRHSRAGRLMKLIEKTTSQL